MKSTMSAFEQGVEAQGAVIRHLTQQLALMQTEVQRLHDENEKLQLIVRELQNDRMDSREVITRHERQLKEYSNTLVCAETKAKKLSDDLEIRTYERDQARAEVFALKQKIAELEAANNSEDGAGI